MTKYITATLILLLSASLAAESQVVLTKGTIGLAQVENDLKSYQRLRQMTEFDLAASGFEDFPMTSDIFDVNYKSPGKGFLYSLSIPGTGQLYSGSKTKAFLFMGVEALAWTGYYIYHKKGVDKEDENRAEADRHWDPRLYHAWLVDELGITDDEQPYLTTDDEGNEIEVTFTHHLPDTKTQQYYEMIGKYDQFSHGWVDTDYRTGDETSAFREQYLLDRDQANKDFDRAKLGAIISIANHLLSAFDAALSARRYNHQQDSFSEYSLKARMVRVEGHQVPNLVFTYKF